MFMLVLGSVCWLGSLVVAAAVFIPTVMSASAVHSKGRKNAYWLVYGSNIAYFVVVIISIIGAWVAAAMEAQAVSRGLLLLPLVNIAVYLIGMYALFRR